MKSLIKVIPLAIVLIAQADIAWADKVCLKSTVKKNKVKQQVATVASTAVCPKGSTQIIDTALLIGAAGAVGLQGLQGTQGPTGPSGVISALSNAGSVSAISGDNAAKTFIAPPLTVSITDINQKIEFTSSAALGSAVAGGGMGLDIYPCYRLVGAPNPTIIGGGMFELTVPQGQRHVFTVNGVTPVLAIGDYQVAMCGDADTVPNAGTWNNNEFAYTSAMVVTVP